MRPHLLRLVGLLAAFVFVVGASACGDGVEAIDPPAAKVNGHAITQDELDTELEAMVGNAKFVEFLESQGNTMRDDAGAFDLAFVTRVLTRQIYLALVHQAFVDQDIHPVTDTDRDLVKTDVQREVGGPEILAAFDARYRTLLLTRSAEVAKLQLALSGDALDEDAMREFYEENSAAFNQTCARHILFSALDDAGQVDTDATAARSGELQAQAVAAKGRIDAGEDFAALAAELSQDASNRDSGGDLECGGAGRFVPEFETALDALQPGQVSAPVQTQFGWHLIKVDSRGPRSFEESAEEIRQQLLGQAQEGFGSFLREELAKADIEVNPRFGRFDKEGQSPGVVPPTPPTTLDVGGSSSKPDDPTGLPTPTEFGG